MAIFPLGIHNDQLRLQLEQACGHAADRGMAMRRRDVFERTRLIKEEVEEEEDLFVLFVFNVP